MTVELNAYQRCLINAPAQTARLSTDNVSTAAAAPMDMGACTNASFHVIWTGLTGNALDGVVSVEVSNDAHNWDSKNAATVTMTTAAGNQIISLNAVVTEQYYRVRLTPNNLSAGLVTVYGVGK